MQGFFEQFHIQLVHNWIMPRIAEKKALDLSTEPLENCLLGGAINNYYDSDVYSRLSPVLISCARQCVSSNFAPRLPPLEDY